tara:strand:- start:293 stop:409 length:117 start_codon:yes stop_codon:yes gene_type:complete
VSGFHLKKQSFRKVKDPQHRTGGRREEFKERRPGYNEN